jgi:hypothetical protein
MSEVILNLVLPKKEVVIPSPVHDNRLQIIFLTSAWKVIIFLSHHTPLYPKTLGTVSIHVIHIFRKAEDGEI